MTEKPRETQAELHVVELKEKVNNSSLMKHPTAVQPVALSVGLYQLHFLPHTQLSPKKFFKRASSTSFFPSIRSNFAIFDS